MGTPPDNLSCRQHIRAILRCCARALRSFFRWLASSFRDQHNFPHFLTALFTLLLAVFAYAAWREAIHGTEALRNQASALQGQLNALKAEQQAWVAVYGFAETPPNLMNKTNQYTEATLILENTGKEPALHIATDIVPIALPVGDWNNLDAMTRAIKEAMHGRECKDIPLNPNGSVLFPGQKLGPVAGFSADDITKINAGTHYAVLAGCIVYETLKERHETQVCNALEHVIQNGGWRSVTCRVYQQAN